VGDVGRFVLSLDKYPLYLQFFFFGFFFSTSFVYTYV
jgi:hypothetical protein